MFFNCLANINKKNKTQILKFYKLRKLPKYEIRFILKKIKIFKHFNYLPLAKINEVYIYKAIKSTMVLNCFEMPISKVSLTIS